MAKLTIKVNGRLGSMSVERFTEIIQHSLKLLHDLDLRVTNRKRPSIKWVLTGLREGSGEVLLESRPISRKVEDRSEMIRDVFKTGMGQLQRKASTPAFFSSKDLATASKIVLEIGRDGITGVDYSEDDEDDEKAVLTGAADLNIRTLTGHSYFALGSIEGTVEVVSVKRGSRHFNVTEARTLKSVRCNFPTANEDDVFDAIRDRRRVVIRGRISYNALNEPLSVYITKPMRFLKRESDLPSISDLAGSDPLLTGALDTEDYVRSLRDG